MIQIVYRCRNCGVEKNVEAQPYSNVSENSYMRQVFHNVAAYSATRVHECGAGVFGFAEPIRVEIIGGNK